jgi:D-3-phosphoglycerate dehydrogenase / 2-oxoglutarate reductase
MNAPHKWKVLWVEHIQSYSMEGKSILERNGCEVILAPPNKGAYSESEIIEQGSDADAILLAGTKITPNVLENLKKLKVIIKSGVGVDNIDIPAATKNGVLVANTIDAADYIGVAEGNVARLLAVAKKLLPSDQNVKAGVWRADRNKIKGVYLKSGLTVGVLGLGRVGSYVVRLLKPWNLRIIAYDPYIKAQDAEFLDVPRVDFDTLLKESDFLSINTVLTAETRHMLNEDALRKMKKTAYIINTARGAIINEVALCKALREGWIAGAALDVFEKEPVEGPILSPDLADKLLLSPHTSGVSDEMEKGMVMAMVEQCIEASKGKPPQFTLNPEATASWKQKFD